MIDYKLIGYRIKEARIKKGLTQNETAQMLEITPEYFSTLERGVSRISLERLAKVSIVLDVTIEHLITGVVVDIEEKDYDEYWLRCKKTALKKIEKIIMEL